MKPRHALWWIATVAAAALTACATSTTSTSQNAAGQAATAAAALATPQVQRQTLAPALYELAHSSRQNAVFAVSAGGFGPDAPASKVFRLDPDTLAVQAELALPLRGFGVALDDAANRLYVGHSLDAAITVVDTASLQPVGTVQLAQPVAGEGGKPRYPHNFRQLVLDPANHRLYAPGLSSEDSALYVVDTERLAVEKVIPGFGQVATGISLDAAGDRLFVSNLRGGLYEVDTRTLALRNAYEVKADQLINLAYDAATRRLLATDQGLEAINARRQKAEPSFVPTPGNRVVVFDPDTGAITAEAATGTGPVALLLDDASGRLFVTDRGAGSVSVFDAQSLALLHTIDLPDHPNSLAIDAKNRVLYVSVKNGNSADRSTAERGGPESVARIRF